MLLSRHTILLGLLLICSLLVRYHTISQGMPYFTKEDEAHHFNRTVRMVQSGDFNPHYFHKPSLHFYLRMPVVAASFLSSVRKGHIRKIQEIQTRDPDGIGGYAFTASHEGIVKWNRAFSVLLHLATVIVLYLLAIQLGMSTVTTLTGVGLFILSPTVLDHSTTIGVDVVVTFFAALTTLLSVMAAKHKCFGGILIAAFSAGLCISSKYNALPIAFVPLLAAWSLEEQHRIKAFASAIIVIPVAFLLASPFILAEIPLFLNHLAYEIYHYGVAGHIGHQASPGFEQMAYYTKWLISSEGLGLLGTSLTFMGIIFSLKLPLPRIVALFPILFIALMITQKANFIRNMLVVMPHLSLMAGWFIQDRFPNSKRLQAGVCLVAFFFPILGLLRSDTFMDQYTDSRFALEQWVNKHLSQLSQTGCDGKLWLSPMLKEQLKCTTFRASTSTAFELYQKGIDTVILPTRLKSSFIENSSYTPLEEFDGITEEQRIIINPAITILERQKDFPLEGVNKDQIPTIQLSSNKGQESNGLCEVGIHRNADEAGCWTTTRYTKITTSDIKNLTLTTPWNDQQITILNENFKALETFTLSPESSKEISTAGQTFYLFNEKVLNPNQISGSADNRNLGVKITL